MAMLDMAKGAQPKSAAKGGPGTGASKAATACRGGGGYGPVGQGPGAGLAASAAAAPYPGGVKICNAFQTTGTCKWGAECWHEHSMAPADDRGDFSSWQEYDASGWPVHSAWHEPQSAANVPPDSDGIPWRQAAEPCSFYQRFGTCKFGTACKFDHSQVKQPEVRAGGDSGGGTGPADWGSSAASADAGDGSSGSGSASTNEAGLPLRPGVEPCPFYVKFGTCKFAMSCRYDHPEGVAPTHSPVTQEVTLNEEGLPLRHGADKCSFYLKTGSCKFGAACRYDHPAGYGGIGIIPGMGDGSPLNDKGMPIRPGKPTCPFFIKTGCCQFGQLCMFDHPPGDPSAGPSLHDAGLPRRPGAPPCSFWMKARACKFGPECRYDHPEVPQGRQAGLGGTRGRRGAAPARAPRLGRPCSGPEAGPRAVAAAPWLWS